MNGENFLLVYLAPLRQRLPSSLQIIKLNSNFNQSI
ncbi:MAG: hypothetical protein KDD33_13750 [Bdellovibrionales bacterium]|nr:hypothetical protein [Bdellovibrionales bacterium]